MDVPHWLTDREATPPTPADHPPLIDGPQKGDIHIEFHDNSGRTTKISSFNDYCTPRQPAHVPVATDAPWSPFKSCADFEFAEVTLAGALNKKQIKMLIMITQCCVKGKDSFNLTSHKQLAEIWGDASAMVSSFTQYELTATHEGHELVFDFWCRPLWEWALDLIGNPHLAPYFKWDAQCLFRYDRTMFMQFIHKPWTANDFWKVQTNLPSDRKPVEIILYADKTKLSSFGTELAYPIIAQLANISAEIRNGQGIRGGAIVGWLPILDDDEEQKGKKSYVDLKHVIWHESFRKLLETVREPSFNGFWKQCGDGEMCRLFPFICILSADYEEQCVMALIQGFRGLCPCPICLVPKKEQQNITKQYPQRTAADTRSLLEQAEKCNTQAQKEEMLKAQGIRAVTNVIWDIANSDPYKAISVDRMHWGSHGLGGKHIWPEIKYLEDCRCGVMKDVDKCASKFPRWQNLNHFEKIVNVHFSNASKFEDILKIVLFITHSLLTEEESPSGYLLLCVLQSYLALDTYAAMKVHTMNTIECGKRELATFQLRMSAYVDATQDESAKNWDFPKNHMHGHLLENILDKGITQNFNTQPNEQMHGPLKDSYHLCTNFKDVAVQILQADMWMDVAMIIRSQITAMEDNDDDQSLDMTDKPTNFRNVQFGSQQQTYSFAELEEAHLTDLSFANLHQKLSALIQNEMTLPSSNEQLTILPEDKLTEYWYIKSFYESRVTWMEETDHLQCTPKFNDEPRYDCVMLQMHDGPIIAQLKFAMTITINSETTPIILVQGSSVATGSAEKDRDMGFTCLWQRSAKEAELFFARSINHSAIIVPAYDDDMDSIVFNFVDPDMFF
ncbi:hypothetical protein L208DRAFT_1297238 [Tricholoma matsutake]|nr:hypothetical protein L208DRAFT_1297238 [Tricholoma matsutake 945]